MPAVISLRAVIEELDSASDDWQSYLDPETGEIVGFGDEQRRLAEEDDPGDLPGWLVELLPKVRQVLESDRWLALPSQFQIHEWQMLRDFALSRADEAESDCLQEAIHGPGAFGRFRDALDHLDLTHEWDAFRDAEYQRLAIEWLEANGLPYTRDTAAPPTA